MTKIILLVFILSFAQLIRSHANNRTKIASLDGPGFTFINYTCKDTHYIPPDTLYKRDKVIFDYFVVNVSVEANVVRFYNGSTTGVAPDKIYALFKCRADKSQELCSRCVDNAVRSMLQSCPNNEEGLMVYSACVFQFSYGKVFTLNCPTTFSDGVASAPTPSRLKPKTQDDNQDVSSSTIAKVYIASFGLVFLIIGLWLCLFPEENHEEESFERMSKQTNASRHEVSDMDDVSIVTSMDALQFDFMNVKTSTCNFSWENKLGEGGYGEVFKGKFPNGQEIAVKRLSRNSQQGAFEFRNEVLLLAKLQHKNLVKLLGFCLWEDEKILIFEFLSNLSLDRFLYDPLKRASLDWEQRFKIIIGVARGLLYLHEDSRLKIIHRDLKASNILLDDSMNAKIADFGLAKLFDSDQTQDITLRIAGTYGYMAPEYVLAGQYSVKSDVYSFGVIVLEIITGQKNRFFHRQEDEGLLHRVWRHWKEDTLELLADPLLGNNFSEEELILCIRTGLLCIQEDPTLRPGMTTVVSALNGQSISLPSPNAPHLFNISDTMTSASSSTCVLLSGNKDQHIKSHYVSDDYTGIKDVTEIDPR